MCVCECARLYVSLSHATWTVSCSSSTGCMSEGKQGAEACLELLGVRACFAQGAARAHACAHTCTPPRCIFALGLTTASSALKRTERDFKVKRPGSSAHRHPLPLCCPCSSCAACTGWSSTSNAGLAAHMQPLSWLYIRTLPLMHTRCSQGV